MDKITKNIVFNEARQPIAVQIDYADWLKIETLLYQHNQIQIQDTNDDVTDWEHQWCELAQKIDKAWKSDKGAMELLVEMRR